MRAARIHELGEPPRPEEVDAPQGGDGRVVVAAAFQLGA
jgi:hypothetical protein